MNINILLESSQQYMNNGQISTPCLAHIQDSMNIVRFPPNLCHNHNAVMLQYSRTGILSILYTKYNHEH